MSKAKKATPKPIGHTDGPGDHKTPKTIRRVPIHRASLVNRKPGSSAVDNTVPRRSDGQQRSLTIPEKESQLQAILDHSPNLVFVKDPAGRYLFVNRRFEDVFHRTREEVINKTDDELFAPMQAAVFRTNDRKVLDAGAPLEFEEVARRDDGASYEYCLQIPVVR